MELHTLRARLTAGLLNKARRGELALRLPAGLARDPTGTVVKSPDREVQARIALVFATLLEKRSAGKVLRTLLAEGLALPRRDRHGDITWRPPTRCAICAILKNPASAQCRSHRDVAGLCWRLLSGERQRWPVPQPACPPASASAT